MDDCDNIDPIIFVVAHFTENRVCDGLGFENIVRIILWPG